MIELGLFRLRTLAFVSLIGLAGCTHLEVNPYAADKPAAVREGFAYMLDFTQYEIKLTRTLVECPAGALPKIKIEATATPSLVPDGAQVYVIKTESLINAFKTTDTTIEYKDGRLSAFNTVVEDKTGDVIKSVAVTAGKIALLASGIPAPVDGSGGEVIGCSPTAVQTLAGRDADKKKLQPATAALDVANAALTDLTTRYTAKPTAALSQQITKQKAVVEAAQKNVDGLTKKVEKANGWLTRSTTVTWPETSAAFDSAAMSPLDAVTIEDWFDLVAIRRILRSDIGKLSVITDDKDVRRLDNDGPSGNPARLRISAQQFTKDYPKLIDTGFEPDGCKSTANTAACKELDKLVDALAPADKVDAAVSALKLNEVSFHIAVRGTYGAPAAATGNADPKAGIRYRVPAAAWLYVCEGNASCALPADKQRVILKQSETVAQLGVVFNLPFSSPPFASGSLAVSFDDKGRLAKGQMKRTNASALAAADAVGALADQATAYDKARRAAPLADLKYETEFALEQKKLADAQTALIKSPKASLEEELAILEAQKKVDQARAALGGDRGAEMLAQLEVAKLETQLAEARKKLVEDPNASQQAVKAQYEAETQVLLARKAQLEAEAAIIKAEEALARAKAGQ